MQSSSDQSLVMSKRGANIAPAQFDIDPVKRAREYELVQAARITSVRFADNLEDMYSWYDPTHSYAVYRELLGRGIECICTVLNAVPDIEHCFPQGVVNELMREENNDLHKVRLHLVKAAVERNWLSAKTHIYRYVRTKADTIPAGVIGDINPDVFGQGTNWSTLEVEARFERILSPLGPAVPTRWDIFLLTLRSIWGRTLLTNPCFVYYDETAWGGPRIFSRSGKLTSYVCEFGAKKGRDRLARMGEVLRVSKSPVVTRALAYLPIDISLAYYWKTPGDADKLWYPQSYLQILAEEQIDGEPFAYWHDEAVRRLVHS